MCSFIHKKGPQSPLICSFVITYVKYLSFCIPTFLVVYPLEKSMERLPFFFSANFFSSLPFVLVYQLFMQPLQQYEEVTN